ncbi:MAG: DUF411 domain-containing protein [Rhodothermales bacterium]
MNRLFALLVIGALALGATACASEEAAPEPQTVTTAATDASLPTVTVYKTPTCGCCSLWVDHMAENGFPTRTYDVESTAQIREQYNMPATVGSCHTATVDGYVVEGHVPAETVKKMLKEKPDIVGITVPGMPIGSPGMEVEGRPADPYDVLAVDADGSTEVYAEIR